VADGIRRSNIRSMKRKGVEALEKVESGGCWQQKVDVGKNAVAGDGRFE